MTVQLARVTLYTLSGCSHCTQARRLLRRRGIAFEEVCGDGEPEFRGLLRVRTGAASVPQILIDDEPIGGSAGLALLDRTGVLVARVTRQRFPIAVVRRRWSARRVPAFVASAPFGGTATPWRYVVELRDRNGVLLERRKAASDRQARELAELVNARGTRFAEVGDGRDVTVDERGIPRGRLARWVLRALYWLVVTVVSLTLVVGLILLLESLDGASVGGVVTIVDG